MADISIYEYIKTLSKEEMAVFICNIQMDIATVLVPNLKENVELHRELLVKWLESKLESEIDNGKQT